MCDLRDALGVCDRESLEMRWEVGHSRVISVMHLEAVMELVWRYTWRPCSVEFEDKLRSHVRVNSEMLLEAIIERDTLGGHDHSNLQAMIERVWRCTWRMR